MFILDLKHWAVAINTGYDIRHISSSQTRYTFVQTCIVLMYSNSILQSELLAIQGKQREMLNNEKKRAFWDQQIRTKLPVGLPSINAIASRLSHGCCNTTKSTAEGIMNYFTARLPRWQMLNFLKRVLTSRAGPNDKGFSRISNRGRKWNRSV